MTAKVKPDNTERNRRIVELYKTGLSFSAIAKELGVTRNVVAGHVNLAGIADRGSSQTIEHKVGDRFGRLVIMERAPRHPFYRGAYWRCRCDCGKFTVVHGTNLRHGATKSCGCLRQDFYQRGKAAA